MEPTPSHADLGLPEQFVLPFSFGSIGGDVVRAGAIDYRKFVETFERSDRALSDSQLAVLREGSDTPVTFDRDNADFLLNFLWAFGLVNDNTLLESGPMMRHGMEGVGRFASTGGWPLATKPVQDLYSSTPIVTLTADQQHRLEEVAAGVFRPCCDNSTAFPDCNHGMAMLGLLELMAAADATTDEMFDAAKYANAFWFPRHTRQAALLFEKARGSSFAEADARQFVGPGVFSASGSQAVQQWLFDHDLYTPEPGSGAGCGV